MSLIPLNNYIVLWPDKSLTVCQAHDTQELEDILNEIANPKMAQIQIYKSPLCFDLNADAPIRSKESIKSFISLDSSRSLSGDLSSYFMNDRFSDIIVRFRENHFPAHKLILASRSETFKSMISSVNTTMDQNNRQFVTFTPRLLDCTSNDVRAMLYFLYSDMLKIDSFKSISYNPLHMLALADEMQLDRLKNLMELEIARLEFAEGERWLGFAHESNASHKVSEWIDIFVLSIRYSASYLRQLALFRILQAAYFAKPLLSEKLSSIVASSDSISIDALQILQIKLVKTSINFGLGCIALNSDAKLADVEEMAALEVDDKDFCRYAFDETKVDDRKEVPLMFASSGTSVSNDMVTMIHQSIFPNASRFWEEDSEDSDNSHEITSTSSINIINEGSSSSDDDKQRKRCQNYSDALMKDKVGPLHQFSAA